MEQSEAKESEKQEELVVSTNVETQKATNKKKRPFKNRRSVQKHQGTPRESIEKTGTPDIASETLSVQSAETNNSIAQREVSADEHNTDVSSEESRKRKRGWWNKLVNTEE